MAKKKHYSHISKQEFKQHKKQAKQEVANCKQNLNQNVPADELVILANEKKSEVINTIIKELKNYWSQSSRITFPGWQWDTFAFGEPKIVYMHDVEKYCSKFGEPTWALKDMDKRASLHLSHFSVRLTLTALITPIIFDKYIPESSLEMQYKQKAVSYLLQDKFSRSTDGVAYEKDVWETVSDAFSPLAVCKLLQNNNMCKQAAFEAYEMLQCRKQISKYMDGEMPDNYADFFPEARVMKRHFVLHLGGTNSGKTYSAIEALKAAPNGIYLAPLRLLAYEQYDKLNHEGVPCSMITGEERIDMPGSWHQSSTIEMLSLNETYDTAVIDEAQMVADSGRGGAWTNAILGIRASHIYLCASPDAEKILIKLIESCGDTYKIVRHERKTPLCLEAQTLNHLRDVQPGDALIVFSRKDVHGVAAELKQYNKKCSIIYGALPYETRHQEAEKFSSGQTEVVVATDAIGMGMNLPIKRVIFLQDSKFDGKVHRQLNATEVQQIAGRAGRYGLYDEGLVTAYGDQKVIRQQLNKKLNPIEKAVIAIPEKFLEQPGSISVILSIWNGLPATQGYDKGDIGEKVALARDLENIQNIKEHVRNFIRFAINMREEEVYRVVKSFYKHTVNGQTDMAQMIDETIEQYNPEHLQASAAFLQRLEEWFHLYDFLYAYSQTYGYNKALEIAERKRQISDMILQILDQGGYTGKTCKKCGKRMQWSSKFGICDNCYHAQTFYGGFNTSFDDVFFADFR